MSDNEIAKGIEGGKPPVVEQKNKKSRRGRRIAKYVALGFLCVLLAALVVNALLSIFMPHYYPTFGKYRLFAIVTDSMDDTIPRGNMIVSYVPDSEADIEVGDVITYEVKNSEGDIVLVTHRVVAINPNPVNGKTSYTTKGDNAPSSDSVHPDFDEIVGVFTGRQCGFFGYFFGFFQSEQGAITLILMLFIAIIALIVIYSLDARDTRKKLELEALKKSEKELSNVSLRYDNIREITAVLDVLGMVTAEPQKRAEERNIKARLTSFIEAKSIELPQTPETAAVLDSLPAPDTPMTLAAALRSGATLRQAEDGQTLILTGMSGGKSILLTPVQTPDGIILCQQGVRLRSDVAPNIESVGAMSMPEYPEFFEGQPLEKNVEYPELPQPKTSVFGPEQIGGVAEPTAVEGAPALSSPTAVGQARLVSIGDGKGEIQEHEILRIGYKAVKSKASDETAETKKTDAEKLATENGVTEKPATEPSTRDDATRSAYAQYRELAARIELQQTEQLSALLDSAHPISPDDRARLDDYKAELKKNKKPRKPLTPEQAAARKAATERRKAEQEAFINALDPSDRELYLSEQKLSRARNATIRRLKRLDADRKLLERLDEDK